MKKLFIFVLAVVMILAFAACSTQVEDTAEEAADTVEDAVAETPEEVPAETPEEAPAETPEEVSAETPEEAPAETPEEAPAETPEEVAAQSWSVKVGDFDVIGDMAPNTFETVTQTLQKVSKDGSLIDQECTGYKLSEILEMAGITDFETLIVVAADGYEYELTAEVALLDTTMIVINQDGEDYDLPRFAVEGEGSMAWVKDVVEIKIG